MENFKNQKSWYQHKPWFIIRNGENYSNYFPSWDPDIELLFSDRATRNTTFSHILKLKQVPEKIYSRQRFYLMLLLFHAHSLITIVATIQMYWFVSGCMYGTYAISWDLGFLVSKKQLLKLTNVTNEPTYIIQHSLFTYFFL